KSLDVENPHERNIDFTDDPEIAALLWANASLTGSKTRHVVPDGEGIIVVDLFACPGFADKVKVEREFESAAEKAAWQPPQWMRDCGCREVTGNVRYSTRNLFESGW